MKIAVATLCIVAWHLLGPAHSMRIGGGFDQAQVGTAWTATVHHGDVDSGFIHRHAPLRVLVSTTSKSILRAEAVARTWATDIIDSGYLHFYSCNFSDEAPQTVRKFLIKLDEIPCEEYPPVRTWTAILHHAASIPDRTRWVLKVDDDTYVNIPKLTAFVHAIEAQGISHSDRYYFGSLGNGRAGERHLIGLDHADYVLGGPGVMLSVGALLALQPVLDTCMASKVPRMHSDTQLGRCMRHLGVRAGLNGFPKGHLNKLFRQFYSNINVRSSHRNARPLPFETSTIDFNSPQFREVFSTLTFHSIKDPGLLHRIHLAIVQNAANFTGAHVS